MVSSKQEGSGFQLLPRVSLQVSVCVGFFPQTKNLHLKLTGGLKYLETNPRPSSHANCTTAQPLVITEL